jgi:hypothetical protein
LSCGAGGALVNCVLEVSAGFDFLANVGSDGILLLMVEQPVLAKSAVAAMRAAATWTRIENILVNWR